MESKKSDGFLTCMQACDTISLMCGMDFNSLIANSKEFTDACAVVLETKLSGLPVDMIGPIAHVQKTIREFLGIEANEGFNSSTGTKILYV